MGLALVFSACDDGGEVSVPADASGGDSSPIDSSTPQCGNGTVETGEDCDDGNTTGGDGCSATCDSESGPVCGNGTVEGAEACDDGNTTNGDGCSSTCTVEVAPACGDGNVDAGETCDDGNTANGDGCSSTCEIEAIPPACGDGNVDAGEACDDGNTANGDGCDENCEIEVAPPTCGDGNVDAGEACDDGNTANGDGCSSVCQIEVAPPVCGDGTVDAGEACDDGNTANGDGCDENCALETPAVCGDGVVGGDEACDDGNVVNGDGCDANCAAEFPCQIIDDCNAGQACVAGFCVDAGVCGNGILEGAETCDDGNQIAGDGCDAACQIEVPAPVCGNGILEEGEECDDGNVVGGDGCGPTCRRGGGAVCGNGRVEMGEQCDDGNVVNGDGCSANCVTEAPVCGNGRVEAGEQCDDGNLAAGDGCSPLCQVELPGAECGNAVLEPGEQCDDGNVVAGDGCDANCVIEAPPAVCGNGAVEAGEACDDGNLDAGDGCDAACQFEGNCGNGTVEGGESCDDGNLVDGDGCDQFCTGERFDLIQGVEQRNGVVPAGGSDLYRFVVDHSNSQLELFTTGCDQPGVDTTLEVFADDGNNAPGASVGFNDDGLDADGLCSRLGVDLPAGVYFLAVSGFQAGALPAYGLDYRLTADVTAPGNYGGAFVANGNDLFVLDVAAVTTYAIGTGDGRGGCPAGDSLMTLFSVAEDGTRVEVATDDDGGPGLCSLISQELNPGRYEVLVEGFSNRAIAAYVLSVAVAGECGDAVINIGEQCDPGPDVADDFCDAACQFIAGCGNARLDAGEQCDPGPDVADDFCDAACQFLAGCGNARIDAGEECDDGNVVAGDGCDAACQTEVFDLVRGIEQRIGGFDDLGSDTYRFVVDHDSSHLLTFTSDGAGGCPDDTTLELLAADANGQPGARVDFNDDAFGPLGTCSLLDTELAPGTYFLVVRGFDGVGIPAYTLDYRLEVDVSGGNGSYAGAFVQNGNDLYVLNHIGGSVAFETGDGNGGCPGDTFMHLIAIDDAGDRVEIATDDDGGAGLCSLLVRDLAPGAYEVEVNGFGNRAIAAYQLAVRFAGECGNGVLELGEECDDGNLVDGDRCAADCTIEPFCGDGALDAGEQCDDGNNAANDGCDPNCFFEQTCGNGVVEGLEACDDGNLNNGDGCSDTCEVEPGCGNGILDAGESCDDGNVNDGDACDGACQVEPAADIADPGDSIELAGSLGAGNSLWARPQANCAAQQPADHFYEAFRIVNNTGADQVLTITAAWLADGFLHVFRDPPLSLANCVIGDDDFNGLTGSQIVNLPIAAGEVLVVVASTFTGGAALGDYTIDVLTQAPPAVCGNGLLEDGEDCDDGNLNPGDGCAPDCTLEPVCGNGVLEAGEGCDDGNLVNGDGCNDACQSEVPPAVCGNGVVEAPEQCDDGNLVNLDGCDALCTPEVVELIRGIERRANGIVATRRDDYFFTVDHTRSHLVARTSDGGAGCPGDTTMGIFPVAADGTVGNRLVFNDDNPAGGVCSLIDTQLNAGRYLLRVLSFNANVAIPAYTLDYRLEVVATAGGQFNGAVPVAQGTDLYTVTFAAATAVDMAVDNGAGACPANADTTLTLFQIVNGARQQVGFNDDSLGLCSRLQANLAPGTYEAVVTGFNNSVVPPYIFNVRFPGPAVCGDGIVGQGETCDDGNVLPGDGCSANCTIEVIAANPIAAPGVSIQLAGALEAADPRWARPSAGCANEAGADHPYDFYRIVNNTGAAQQITITAAWAAGDGYIHVFSDPFFGAAAPAGCVIGDDDFAINGAPAGRGSQLTNVNIAAGQTLVVVASSFAANANIGAYTIDILTQLPPAVCGNGVVEAGEQCDDGNIVPGDGCNAACQTEPRCGNGVVEAGEQCDDGNVVAGDGCSAACQNEQVAPPTPIAARGQTVRLAGSLDAADPRWARPSEACAAGAADRPYDAYRIVNNTGAAQQITVTAAWAGDGFLHVFSDPFNAAAAPAGCLVGGDDFNGLTGSRVTNVNIAPGQVLVVVASSFAANANIGAYTLDILTQLPAPVCGNGQVEAGEQCDDGNVVAGDGCSPTCQTEPRCGNGVVEAGEQCDDGNLVAGDGCSAACQNEQVAPATPIAARGATIRLAGSLDAADPRWARPSAACGAGAAGKPYDAFRIVNNTGVAQQLTITAAWAGDGFLHVFNDPFDAAAAPAGCIIGSDDFNGANGSRVTNVNIAAGQVLVVVASTFSANANIGPYTIDVLTQLPPAVCGNSVVEAGEQCDDGNVAAGDGCSPTCQNEPRCGDGVVTAAVGEECDDANQVNGDGCDTTCSLERFDVIAAVFRRASRIAQGSSDTFRFTIDDAGSVLAITGDGTPNGLGCINVGDTFLELFPVINGVRGPRIISDNDAGFDLCSRLYFPVLQPGTYEVVVTESGNDAPLPAYTLDMFVAVDANQFGQFEGSYPANGSDGYLFTLNQAQELLMFTGDGAGGCGANIDTLIDLFSVNAQTGALSLVANDDDSGVGNCSSMQRVLQAGTYAAVVRGFQATTAPAYIFEIECLDCLAMPVPPTPGSLVITEVMQNPAAVADASGEWFEVLNVSDTPLNLNGMIVADDATANERFTVNVDLIVLPGEYAVFGVNANEATNGGVAIDFAYPTAAAGGINPVVLGNATDGLILVMGAAEIDRVIWDNGATFPNPNGPSMQFNGALDPAVDNNALGTNWCLATVPYGPGNPQDRGTPGADNTRCPVIAAVRIENFLMNPSPVTIHVGDSVRWTNADAVQHTVTSGNPGDANAGSLFDSPLLNQNATFQFTFPNAGTFNYFCRPHQGFMFGFQVVVLP